MKKLYQCEVCFAQYDSPELALQCEAKPIPPPKAKAGDTVYIRVWQPDDPQKPYAKRVIHNIYRVGHRYGYELNRGILIARGVYIGTNAWYQTEDERPAWDSDIFLPSEIKENEISIND